MWNKPTYRHLAWALLVSVLVHWAAVGRLPSWLWRDMIAPIPIQVQLVTPPPAVAPPHAPVPAVPPPVEPPPVIRLPVAEPEPVPTPPPEETVVPAPVALPALPAEPVVQPPVTQAEAVPAPVAETAPPAEEKVAEPAYVFPQDEAAPALPQHVEIDFSIRRKGSSVGVERQRFQVDAGGRYTLSSVAEAKGLLALALSDLVQESSGSVTPHGLRPEHFRYQYGRNADKAQLARFDWSAGTLHLQTGARQQSQPLQEGVQDLLSFMYQFMYAPPLEQMQLSITNGKRLRTYDYGFEGEETLETAMGKLRCIHIGRTSNDDEKTEIWLAADYHYLPVKISKTEKDGTLTERIATRLQIE